MNPPEGAGAIVGYITGFRTDLSQATFQDLREWSIENELYVIKNVYDISEDGNRILLRVYGGKLNEDNSYRVYVYDVKNPMESDVVNEYDAEGVVTASFSPTDEGKIWLFNEMGIVQYDLELNQATVINKLIDATVTANVPLADPAQFSPDGHYLAVVGEEGLYVVELTEEVAV